MREPFGPSPQETGLFQISHSLTLCRSCTIKQGKKLLWIFTLTYNVRRFVGNPILENVLFYLLEWSYIHAGFCIIHSCGLILWGFLWLGRFCSNVTDAMREAKRETVEPLENMNWQKEERCCHLHHCVQVHQEKPEWKSFSPFYSLSFSLSLHLLHVFLPLSLYFSLFLSLLCPLLQQLTLHTQEQTEISIHVLPHCLATPANGSMQLACTHSKRPFEYSSANSCIHWYLKCSGSARALNPRYIWLNLKKRTKTDIGDKDQDSFYCAAASNTKWQAQIGMCLCLFPSQKMKACTLSIFTATHR